MILALQIVSNRSAITIILEQKIYVCFLSSSEAKISLINIDFIGVLITGGVQITSKVELFDFESGSSCRLPDLPESRWGHSSHEGVLCGGGVFTPTRNVCKKMINGVWTITHNLTYPRSYHCSWEINPGISFMLLGGVDAQSADVRTTDIVFYNGTIKPGFDLAYDARLVCHKLIKERPFTIKSKLCMFNC